MSALSVFSPKTRAWFEGAFEAPTPAQEQGWPAIASGKHTLIQAPTGSGKTLAAFLYGIDRLTAIAGQGPAAPLRVAAEGAQLRRGAQPAGPARGARLRPERRGPDRRHAAAGPRRDAPRAPGHPDHDSGVALPPAHVPRARDAEVGRDADPRRGARGRRHEARGAPGALGRAARPLDRGARPARRPVRDATADGGDRAVRLGSPADRAGGRGSREGARPEGRRSSRGHAGAGRERIDLALDLPGGARARAAAPIDDRLRQQPPPRRAARAEAERAGERRRRGGRAHRDRACPSRLARPRAAARGRGAPEEGRDPVPRRHVVARARDRHGRRRPRDPGRVAEVGGARACSESGERATSSAPSREGASSRSSGRTCSSRPSSSSA